jgi:hypothetical protein
MGEEDCVVPYTASLPDPRSRRHGYSLPHTSSRTVFRIYGGTVIAVSPVILASPAALHRAVCHYSSVCIVRETEEVRPVEGPAGRCPALRFSLVPHMEFWGPPLVHSAFPCIPHAHMHIPQSLNVTSSGKPSLILSDRACVHLSKRHPSPSQHPLLPLEHPSFTASVGTWLVIWVFLSPEQQEEASVGGVVGPVPVFVNDKMVL